MQQKKIGSSLEKNTGVPFSFTPGSKLPDLTIQKTPDGKFRIEGCLEDKRPISLTLDPDKKDNNTSDHKLQLGDVFDQVATKIDEAITRLLNKIDIPNALSHIEKNTPIKPRYAANDPLNPKNIYLTALSKPEAEELSALFRKHGSDISPENVNQWLFSKSVQEKAISRYYLDEYIKPAIQSGSFQLRMLEDLDIVAIFEEIHIV